jgi:hypothetical protein
MEATYSSVPQTRKPIRTFVFLTLGAIALGIVLWKYDQRMNEDHEKISLI